MSASISKPVGVFGALAGLIGFSALAGVLVTAMVTPALAVTSMTASNTVGIFEDLPDYMTIDQLPERNTLYAMRDGAPVVFAQVYAQNRQQVAWDQVSDFVKKAAVAGEDRRFYEHGGVDLAGIARAAVNNATSDTTQGASTIDQQLVKNILITKALEITDEADRKAAYAAAQANTIDRKLKEAKLAVGLEKRYTKQEILLGYLNIAGFGGNTYGIESAAQQYYSTTAANLTLAQAASLIAIVQQPNLRSPADPENWQRNQTRRDAILGNMLAEKMIDQAQYDEAVATPVNETTVIISEPKSGCLYASDAKFFCDYVLRNVKNLEGLGATPEERVANFAVGGYDIYTSVDLTQQVLAEQLLAAETPPTETRFALGSAVSTVQVGTGRILVMAQNKTYDNRDASVGGGAPSTTSVNYNTDADYGGSSGFQPGSAYKLFTLVDWLEKGHGLNEIVDGTQKTYTPSMLEASCAPNGGDYKVRNDGGRDAGRVSVRQATAGSINAAFYSMASKLDLCDIRDTAARMGVHRADGDPLNTYPSIVLGTDEVAPLSMANAYATISNNGVLCSPIAVDKIVSPDGTELPGQTSSCDQVISPDIAHAAATALQGVMRGGTGAASNPNDGTPLIGKTGTADAFHTWILSASTTVATAVWVGNIVGQQSLRRISLPGGNAATARHRIMRPLQASLDAGVGAGATAFPDPPPSLVNGSSQAVPNVAGQTEAAGRTLVESLGFDFAVGGTVASELPAGRIVSSDPPGGTLVSKGSTVTVSISDGSLAVTMPDVVGQTLKEAQSALAQAGFDGAKITIDYVASNPKDSCKVAGSNPASGSATSKAAAVALIVNGGILVPGKDPGCS